jgi:hypothetical protein
MQETVIPAKAGIQVLNDIARAARDTRTAKLESD